LKVLKWIVGLLAAFVVVVLGIIAIVWFRLQPSPPELQVWSGGHIITMDPERPVATAIALERDRIVAVGDSEDVEPWLEQGALEVDLEGKTVVPGFIEAHGHFPGAGLSAVSADLNSPPIGEIRNVAEAISALRAVADDRPGSEWVMGFGYDDTMLEEKRHLTRADLDAVSTTRPVLAFHISAHMVVVNSVALERYGIGSDTPDPPGGEIRKDAANGEPTGLLLETAARPVMLDALAFAPLDQLAVLRAAVESYAEQGFTTVQNGYANREQLEGLSLASKGALIPLRIVAWPADELALEAIDRNETFDDLEGPKMHVTAVKFIGDGSIQGYTGYLREPYYALGDHPEGYRGYPSIDPATLNAHLKKVHCAGYPVAVHGNGDAAIDQFLDAWEGALEACPEEDARPILVHAQMAQEDQLDRMVELGVAPTFFSAHVYYWGDRHRDVFLGPERAARISPVASAAARGLRFTTHLDTPIVPIDSQIQLWTPVSRETSSGAVLGPDQRIDAEQSLRAMTIDAAWQSHLEDELGSIEVGKLADLVVLSDDPLAADLDLRTISVEKTVVGGVTVFEAD
jgi:predicted amidohydrolase YtcJ